MLEVLLAILISLANLQDITQHQVTNMSTSRCQRKSHENKQIKRLNFRNNAIKILRTRICRNPIYKLAKYNYPSQHKNAISYKEKREMINYVMKEK